MDSFFNPIKNKVQTIALLMHSIKYMLINPIVSKERKKGEIIVNIDKMSRIFFSKDDKYFSVTFPFTMKFDGSCYSFSFKNQMDIDSKLTTEVLALINEPNFTSGCSLEFADKISLYQEDTGNEHYWNFLREMLVNEDGYLRYDYDNKNYLKHNKSDIHPLNHLDIFYGSNATFKVGIRRRIKNDEFLDLLNIKTKCNFIAFK
ncbi:hypothetical protein [Vibrio jasicida]|uniref:hypothetical protein n=1 Tax=Vibrio jasicida TaxID=766224 RepID=UPI00391E001D